MVKYEADNYPPTSLLPTVPAANPNRSSYELFRKLQTRHLSMIALGGCIGTGLYLASGKTIATAGPGGALVAYAVVGLIVYFIISSLGEMATYMPISGSFNTYAGRFVEPALGFALGWNYWYSWAVTVAAELAAVGLVMKFWFPTIPSWIWALVCIVILLAANMVSVRGFGELEYWLSLIKVLTIIVFLVVAVLLIVGAVGGQTYGIQTWQNGDAFHGGFSGMFTIFLVASFSFQGTELVGITAGESAQPRRDVPRAVNQVIWRILIFYIGAIFCVGLIVPYNDPSLLNEANSVSVSPFTLVFTRAGWNSAAQVMNAIILVTVLSAGNSGMYAASRTLYVLAKDGNAPRFLGYVDKRGIPINALIATTVVGCVTFASSFIGDNIVYIWLLSLAGISGLVSWFGILLAHWRFRRAYVAQGRYVEDLPYIARLFPVGPLLSMLVILVIIGGQGYGIVYNAPRLKIDELIAAYIGIPVFFVLYLGYKILVGSQLIPLTKVDLDTDRQGFNIEHERLQQRREEETRYSGNGVWNKIQRNRIVRALEWV